MKDRDKRSKSTLRSSTDYNVLLHRFDDAVEKIWPEGPNQNIYAIDGTCTSVSNKTEDIEGLILASYRLMRYIRSVLVKKKLPYKEGLKFPNLYTALEHAVAYTTRGEDSLAIEADKLEAVSRAGYHWLQLKLKLGRSPLRSDFEPRQPTWQERQSKRSSLCFSCKTNVATDDVNMLCNYCSGATNEKSSPVVSVKCVRCKMPCKHSDIYCELCKAESKPWRPQVVAEQKAEPTTVGGAGQSLRRNHVTAHYRAHDSRDSGLQLRGPFDHIERQYPTGKLQDWGDIMLPSSRINKVI